MSTMTKATARWAALALALTLALGLAACTTRDAEGFRRADSVSAADDSIANEHAAAAAAPAPEVTEAGGAVSGAAGAGVDYFTAAQLDQVAAALSHGSTTGRTLGSHPTYQYLQIRRTESGVPEIHERWIDVTMVQSGRASMLSGGHVTGGADQGGGERRGGQIVGGARRSVGAGDLMVIPAGVPHQYEIAHGDSLRYVTVKVLAGPR